MTKKKTKAISLKNLRKSDSDIFQVDSNTYYARSSKVDEEGKSIWYYVYYSTGNENQEGKGWLCDCMSYIMKMRDDGKNPHCKHITKIIEKYKK